MTTEERFERIEHITAGMAEQAHSDREENRRLWRETQRQIDELGGHVTRLTDELGGRVARITIDIDRLILESAARDKASRERDEALDTRLDKLVSAIGEFIAAQAKNPLQ